MQDAIDTQWWWRPQFMPGGVTADTLTELCGEGEPGWTQFRWPEPAAPPARLEIQQTFLQNAFCFFHFSNAPKMAAGSFVTGESC